MARFPIPAMDATALDPEGEFWNLEGGSLLALALENGSRISYADLRSRCDDVASWLPERGRKQLGLVLCRNCPQALWGYLAALRSHHAVWLVDEGLEASRLADAIETYRPDWIWQPRLRQVPSGYHASAGPGAYELAIRRVDPEHRIFDPLAVLLSTSGSTGSPKLVRLSARNLVANAAAIATYLDLSNVEHPITTLPMSYSYGLSVLNSHLLARAALLLTDRSVVDREFWEFFETAGATSLAGVPYLYQVLRRLDFASMRLPSLRTLTQAGGRMDPEMASYFAKLARVRGWRYFAMYGQTEATARISYLPPDLAERKAGSIGRPISGGQLEVDPATGELIYRGPNVMLGYASGPEDLALGDLQQGVLRTGDLGHQDADGLFYVTGRSRRILKIKGHRLSLDDLERDLESHLGRPVACLGSDDRLAVVVDSVDQTPVVRGHLQKALKLHPRLFAIRVRSPLPRTGSGKIDYAYLATDEA